MSDRKEFSVDDILEEYSSKTTKASKTASGSRGFDLDDLDSLLSSLSDKNEDKALPSGSREPESSDLPRHEAEASGAYEAPEAPEAHEVHETLEEYEASGTEEAEDKLEELVLTASKPREKKKSRINTSVIERMVREKKSGSENTGTISVDPVNRASVKDIDMGLEGKIIPKTEQLEIGAELTEEEKIELLEKRREKKVQSFVLSSDEAAQGGKSDQTNPADRRSHEGSKTEKEQLPIDEFTEFDQAQDVLADIMRLKSNIVTRLCVLVFTALFAVYISLANDFDLPIISVFSRSYSPEAFVFTLTILGIVASFVSYTVIFGGIKKLICFRADCDSIAAIGIVLTVITGIVNLFAPESIQTGGYHIYTAAAILGLLFNTLGKFSMVNRAYRNLRFAAGEFEKHAFVKVEDEDIAYKFTKGTLDDFPELATTRKTEFVDDFLANSYSSDISDEYSRRAAPIIVIASVLAALISFAVCEASGAERIMTALGSMCGLAALCSSPAVMLIVNLPLARASKKYLQSSAVLLGYSAVEEYSDTNSVLIDAEQLFPDGMVELVNLKAMSSTLIEDCILYAASLSCQAGGIMKSTFYKMLRGKTEMLYPVESYIYEDGLGLSGWIEHKRILFGSRELMENHSIEGLPSEAKEQEYAKGNIPVYLSISGVVSAIFFIRAGANLSVSKWLQELTDRNVTVVIRSVDAFISTRFLSELFEVEPDKLKLLPFRFHKEYEKEKAYVPRVSSPMMCSGHFPSIAMLICGTKNIQTLSVLGMMLQLTSAGLGAIIALILAAIGSFSQLTASVAICYNLVWLAATMLIQQFKRV